MTMTRTEAFAKLSVYIDDAVAIRLARGENLETLASEMSEILLALGIGPGEVTAARNIVDRGEGGAPCGAINPRTGMVCNVPPHTDDKHWTVAADGQRYDWFEKEPRD